MDKQVLYDQRMERINKALHHEEPDRVPILSLLEYFAISYAGKKFSEATSDPQTEIDTYAKIHRDAYFDGAIFSCVMHSIDVYKALGADSYFVSDDDTTLQHRELCPMTPDDYDEIARDFKGYIYNTFFKRKYPKLQGDENSAREAVRASILASLGWAGKVGQASEYYKNELGMPVLAGSLFVTPLDMIFDFLRGFKGTLKDIRKCPEKIKAANEAITDYVIELTTTAPVAPFPWFTTPLHIEPFISHKAVEELYWPYYKRILDALYEKGATVWAYLEGTWAKCFDLFQDIPKDFMIAGLESDDIKEAKKIIGGNIALSGGMDIALLKFGTQQECIDSAKSVIDACAPGGGYYFCSSMDLISPKDANPENLIAVNEFVHNYAYK